VTLLLAFLPFVLSAALSGDFDDVPERPTNTDLERALRETAGQRFGADDESPIRPHEMLLRMDAKVVPDDLLLGILLSGATAGGDPVEAARRLLVETSHDMTRLREVRPWARTRGVGDVGRARVVAALELARRIDLRESFAKRRTITSPEQAVEVLKLMSLGDYESLSALFLDRRRRLVGGRTLTVGSSGFTVVDPKQIFREAVEMGADAVILAHNHPSGDATPSSQDLNVTERVARAGRVIGIPLIDHLVLGANGTWTSFASIGELPRWETSGPVWTAEPVAGEPDSPPYVARGPWWRWSGQVAVELLRSTSDGDLFQAVVTRPDGRRFRSMLSRTSGRGSSVVTDEQLDQVASAAISRAGDDGFDVSLAQTRLDGAGYRIQRTP